MRVCTGFHHSRKSRPISNQAAKQTVSADVHHGKCANENLPKSEYGSLLKGCRRSTNWNLFGRFDYPLIKKFHLFIRMKPMLSIFHNRKC